MFDNIEPNTIKILYYVYLLLTLTVIVIQFRKKNWLNVVPTLGWFALMSFPFILQWGTLVEGPRVIQAAGIMITGCAILLGDSLKLGPDNDTGREAVYNYRLYKLMTNYLIYVLLFLVISIYHLMHLNGIPLLEIKKFILQTDPINLLQMRENSSKLLDVPSFFKYMFTWLTSTLAPVALLLMLKSKYYCRAFLFLIVAIAYAEITLAKFPVIIMFVTISIAWFALWKPKLNKYIYAGLLIVILIITLRAGILLATNTYSGFIYKPESTISSSLPFNDDDPRKKFSLSDNFRLVPKEKVTPEVKFYNYITYRIFLVPSDVSSRWYQYFPEVNGGYFGVSDLIWDGRGANFVHPSRKVGIWGYADRFPDKYKATINAYASVDADSYARLGMSGVMIGALLLLCLRLIIKLLRVDTFLSRILYAMTMVQLALLPAQSSLPALLAAHGLIFILLLMFLLWLMSTKLAAKLMKC